MRKLTALLTALICILLISCSKENSLEQRADFLGTFKFISLEANTVATQQATMGSDVEKTVTLSHYLTKENTGTVTFTTSTASSNNVSYSIDTMMKSYFYTNNALDDSLEMPFQINVPPSSATSEIKIVSSDSVYFPSGTIFYAGMSQPTTPSGARIKREGNRLYLLSNIHQTGTETMQGVSVLTDTKANMVITLEKM